MYDIIIIGAGPAGMTAAIYAKQAKKNVLILEKSSCGGQILKANKVKNYPGFSEITGFEFSNNLYNQIKELGVEIKFEKVISIENTNNSNIIKTNKSEYKAKAIIIASGVESKKLNIKNEEKFIGKGVSYCTTCDGMFFKNKTVAIIGGGNSSIDGALYLSDICKKVYIIYRKKDFKIDSENLEITKKRKNVEFILDTNVIDLIGDNKLEKIIIKNNSTNEEKELNIEGLFIEIGKIPLTSMTNNLIETDDNGFIISNENCTTNLNSIFVAGDIRKKAIRQLTTAVSDGTIAALNACKYLKNIE